MDGVDLKSSMYLPDGYMDSDSYIHDALHFLSKYRWIFNFPVTNLLVSGVFDSVPVEWVETLLSLSNQELNDLPNGFMKETWPESLQEFCKQCQALKLPLHSLPGNDSGYDIPTHLCHGLTIKKQHEVARLAALIHKECSSRRIRRILDIGSGLGYLDQVLHHQYGYEVLGLESNPHHVEKAEVRYQGLRAADGKVSYLQCEVSAASKEEVQLAIREKLLGHADTEDSSDACLVGLHCCGDLAASASDLFLNLPVLQLFIVLPCCYHKMSLLECRDEQEIFKYFPQSKTLKRSMDTVFMDARTFLCRPFLRLASQETCAKWEQRSEDDHAEHSLNLMARAVLYLYAKNAGVTLKKKRRRGVRKTRHHTFSSILEDILLRYDFITEDKNVVLNVRQDLTHLWSKYSGLCRLAEAVTGLQMMMQSVAESFVLVDKMIYLQENNDTLLSYDLIKVMDDNISARCHALVARKYSSAL
ncbi:methyltransferase-like protein 25B isoform X2 [Anabrus simplex]|uniref:methyltransferase-like protein 25B isoform X2 n=1 Tax=Anabrus simplex TaxID=316456 RepID=UPI0035A34DF3